MVLGIHTAANFAVCCWSRLPHCSAALLTSRRVTVTSRVPKCDVMHSVTIQPATPYHTASPPECSDLSMLFARRRAADRLVTSEESQAACAAVEGGRASDGRRSSGAGPLPPRSPPPRRRHSFHFPGDLSARSSPHRRVPEALRCRSNPQIVQITRTDESSQ